MRTAARPYDGWRLEDADDAVVDTLIEWLPDEHSVNTWGGPKFRYPFTRETFVEDCRWGEIASLALRDAEGHLAGFGQVYERHGRINLARLIAHPERRGQGIGKRLVDLLMRHGAALLPAAEFSLYVYRDNLPAYYCYKSLGFEIDTYPDGDPLADVCHYMTRPVADYRDGGSQ